MTARTPGPYLRDGTTVYALDQRRDDVFREENVFTASVQDANGIATPGELEAVAQLFKAAPTLLAAARSVNAAYKEFRKATIATANEALVVLLDAHDALSAAIKEATQ